jgi:ABC-type uncharacterized transport system involved in gliding motility auxiliary subunit
MDKFFRSGLILIAGIALLALSGVIYLILLEGRILTTLIAVAGLILSFWGAYSLRAEFATLLRQRRGEILLSSLGVVAVLCAFAYLSVQFSTRVDMTEEGRYSLSEQTLKVLQRLEKPINITFFHDPMMREQVELYELMGSKTSKLKLEFFDPMLNPAQARLLGVQFAGTALLESEGRKMQLNSHTETEIANAILRISLGVTQTVCFLAGHREADPFSQESHDHMEGTMGHTHGLGSIFVQYELHGMSKARSALETLNYTAEKLTLSQGAAAEKLGKCSLLVVAGPKQELMPAEIETIRHFLAAGGNGFFMIDPFIRTGLEPVLLEYGIVADNTIIIDESSHFWADPSSPAVTDYNYHAIVQDLPLTFFPGARSLSPTAERVPRTDVIPLINSSKQSFGETSAAKAHFDEGIDRPGPLTIMAVALRRPVPEGDILFPTPGKENAQKAQVKSSMQVTGRSRIAVIGDSDFATNSFFHVMGNGRLFLNTVNYLASKESLIGMEPRSQELPRVNLTNRQMKGTFFLAIILVPALLAAIGCAVWWRQR